MKRTLPSSQSIAFAFLLGMVPAAYAATTDLADAPMASSSSSVVKPNIMFILDDSGSMSFNFTPDDAWYFGSDEYGSKSHHCNGIYYNPSVSYIPPVDSNGASYPDASFTAAWTDGFNTSAGAVDLTGSYYYTYTGTQPDLGFTYDNKGNLIATTFYNECNSREGRTPGSKVFTKVTIDSAASAAAKTNFANWYSYYRTRMLMMKTAAGRAFSTIGSNYRVGYSTISYAGTDSADTRFLKVSDFDATQKASFYSKLYGAQAIGWTPLRAALSKAGRLYAGKLLTGADDPLQYSCQQNFTILSTDGYWNNNAETGSYGPLQIDGTTTVGDQDHALSRPMYDSPTATSDTLADVAAYYYNTDLRTTGNCTGALGTDVCVNNVPGAGDDKQLQQHMTTFTLGLGVNGTLKYTEDYQTATSGDFSAIKQGTLNWPDPITNSGPERVDDLWHAAVNGHGTYFSAQSPNSLVSGISKALAGVSARTGSAAAAATSNLEPVAGDNYVYVALYRTVKWDGDLQAKTIDPSTGTLSTTPEWSAQPLLDAKVSASSDTRTIYTFDSGAPSTKLKSFIWASLTAAEQGYFNNVCSGAGQLSQCSSLTLAQQSAASGANMVNYLRGQNGNEDRTGNADPLYRAREHVLGDMIDSQPVYVKQPPFSYADANYSDFKKNTRTLGSDARVYVAVNDGMLHAFSGDTGANGGGVEQWAYIPPMVMPNLYKLADKNYASNHQYYVDGSPTVGDVCPNAPVSSCSSNQWKTILVGGLNKGGRGYYALDITNPSSPKALWNYTVNDDQDLGYSYGNPIITKRKDGTWVVVFASGYNNVNPGDGKGHLYVLNAYTGARLEKIDTTAGDTTTPSGLAKINAWIDNTTDNTARRFYGGDLLGNVWRFDIDDVVPPAGKEALLLAQLGNVGTVGTQPITTKPELTEISSGGSTYAVVSVATGRYLGVSDLSDTSQQSIYSFKDNLTATGLGKVRTAGVLVQQSLTTNSAGTGRTTTTNAVNWGTNSGWYVDLNPNNESPGERVNVDMQQQLGLLTVAANVPENNACTLGGYAWLYNFDYKTGQYVQTATNHLAGRRLGQNALVAGLKTIKLTTGKTVTLVTDTGGGINGEDDPTSNPGLGSGAKRVSWRELLD